MRGKLFKVETVLRFKPAEDLPLVCWGNVGRRSECGVPRNEKSAERDP